MNMPPSKVKVLIYWCTPITRGAPMQFFDTEEERDCFVKASGKLMITGTKKVTCREAADGQAAE